MKITYSRGNFIMYYVRICNVVGWKWALWSNRPEIESKIHCLLALCISIILSESGIFVRIRDNTWKMPSIALCIDAVNLLGERNYIGGMATYSRMYPLQTFPFFPRCRPPLILVRMCPLFQNNPSSIMSQHRWCLLHGGPLSLWLWSHNLLLLFSLLPALQAWDSDASPNPSASRLPVWKGVFGKGLFWNTV